MTREAFESWAPAEEPWSAWAKPAPFVDDAMARADAPFAGSIRRYDLGASADTCVVIDLPGPEAVRVGLALAAAGFRPVPLINTTSDPSEIIGMGEVLTELRLAARMLEAKPPARGAPPAFVLDARRMEPSFLPAPGRYDNRWLTLPQDFPSARTLRERGIQRCVLLSEDQKLADDLAHVLRRFQEAGIAMHGLAPGPGQALTALDVPKPRWFKQTFYRFLVTLGLRRNQAGGFGSAVPMASGG